MLSVEKRNTETMITVFQYLGGTHSFHCKFILTIRSHKVGNALHLLVKLNQFLFLKSV